ncbi:DUF2130 domain-containing protein [Bradyrhizobium sp. CSS354]|uniref:DUF2130 domain-containing protein n=1 Tax=Bradyrhizobium sp. CSS354 TaxID=2699172 RepID=UPI0023B04446|nr:DUF2130 domain-containing protein [Bradyrhizobium sp. CSS354]MDE5462213.1 DUF2130 domain-containing protein [Bradyrhizobium sp. CSS354]
MIDPHIVCTNCGNEIKLTESLAAPLVAAARHRFEQQLAAKEIEFDRREAQIREAQNQIARAKVEIDEQVAARLGPEQAKIAEVEASRARQVVAVELGERDREIADLRQLFAMNADKLTVAQMAHAETLRKQRELDDAKRELELTVEKRVQQELAVVHERAKIEAEDDLRCKVSEKEAQIASMQRRIEDLRRKAEQGSQQLQGEAQEIELEALLRSRFPTDLIEEVPKGVFGGDIVQRVVGPGGQMCGTILWESKKTRSWSDGWLPKLRDDQRAARADVAAIVSTAMPEGLDTFDLVGNVWVVKPRFAAPVAIALRQALLGVAGVRACQEGQQTKMELVYTYLTGSRFRHRIEAIVERFSDMQSDLDRERKAMTRLWAKREEQLSTVLETTVGLYGDLQGIAGRAMPEIECLDVVAIATSPEPPSG